MAQKGVDIKLGIDIASLAYKRLVERVVLITGDSDFVPAAKLARREGLDVVLDPLWNRISPSLHEHIDGLKSVWPNPVNRVADEGERSEPTLVPSPVSTSIMSNSVTAAEVVVEARSEDSRGTKLRAPWRRKSRM